MEKEREEEVKRNVWGPRIALLVYRRGELPV